MKRIRRTDQILSKRFSNFKKGLNTLVHPSKIENNELSAATNVILVDDGTPERRYGTVNYTSDSGTDGTRGLFSYYNATNGEAYLVKIQGGIFKKQETDNTWSVVSGASFTSGISNYAVLLNDILYIQNGVDDFTKYDGTSLTRYTEINSPASISAVRGGSLPSGNKTYTYRVTAVSNGETLASDAVSVYTSISREDWDGLITGVNENKAVKVTWGTVSGATGYNIYGVDAGFETYLATVKGNTNTSWTDYGTATPSNFFTLPTGNSTAGVKGKYIIEFKSALLLAGNDPSRVWYSAGIDKPDSFLLGDGGGFIDISKSSDQGDIVGLASFQNKAIIFKERSIWDFDFTDSLIPSLANIMNGLGAISHNTIKTVENDLYFLGSKKGSGVAVYVLGNEPNYFTILRTNELTARVRPELYSLSPANYNLATAEYFDSKYILFFASGGSSNNTALVYDRERLGFTKWSGFNIANTCIFYDGEGVEHLCFVDPTDDRVSEFLKTATTDKGTAIEWGYRIKEEDFGDPFTYKRFWDILLRFKNVRGSNVIKLYTDTTTVLYTTTIAATTGETFFGSQKFGSMRFGSLVAVTDDQPTTVIKRIPIRRQGSTSVGVTMSVGISGTDADSKAALLDVVIDAKPKSIKFYPRGQEIN